jgi:hypothetical protein
MKPFEITVRTAATTFTFSVVARSSSELAVLTAEVLGDEPCGITVTRLREAEHG